MIIHISDCQSFDQNVEISLPCSIHSLLEHIMTKYKYDTTLCSVFKNGQELEFGFQITPELLKSDNTLILFNQLFFKEKSFSNSDQSFKFPQSRFQNNFFDVKINKIKNSPNKNNETNNNYDFEDSYYNYLQGQIVPELSIPQDQVELEEQENEETNEYHEDEDENQGVDIESIADLDPSEQESVDRLCSLGFDRLFVIQIFMACDRNEEAALDLLRSM